MIGTLLLDRSIAHVVTLTFNRPDVRNALNWEMQHQFLAIIKSLLQDNDVQVLILTGVGEQAFCAGGDVVELANYKQQSDGTQLAAIMSEALNLMESAPFVSIAAINGVALGGGAEVALACDLRIMDAGSKLGLVQMQLGLTPGWGAVQRLLRLVGYSRALQILLEATPIDASQAMAAGLIAKIASSGSAYDSALEFAKMITSRNSDAVKAVKRLLRAGLTLSYDDAQAAEQAEFPALWASEAHLKAVDDFLNRKAGSA